MSVHTTLIITAGCAADSVPSVYAFSSFLHTVPPRVIPLVSVLSIKASLHSRRISIKFASIFLSLLYLTDYYNYYYGTCGGAVG
jgi:hypothetical protein